MPADPRTRVVADQQRLGEFVRMETGEPRRIRPQREQPVGDRFGRGKAPVVEVVAPAVNSGQPFALPLMETEGRQRRRVDRRDQRLLLFECDDRAGLRQPGKAGFGKDTRKLDTSPGASGPYDLAVRVRFARHAKLLSVHRIPSHVRGDRDPPLHWNGTLPI